MCPQGLLVAKCVLRVPPWLGAFRVGSICFPFPVSPCFLHQKSWHWHYIRHSCDIHYDLAKKREMDPAAFPCFLTLGNLVVERLEITPGNHQSRSTLTCHYLKLRYINILAKICRVNKNFCKSKAYRTQKSFSKEIIARTKSRRLLMVGALQAPLAKLNLSSDSRAIASQEPRWLDLSLV